MLGKPGLTLDIIDSGPNVASARAACQPILDELTNEKVQAIGPAGIEAQKHEAERYAAWMREHGVELGEPQAPLYEVGPLLDQADRETSKATRRSCRKLRRRACRWTLLTAPEPGAGWDTRAVRILVVDDERAVRDGLDRVLRAEGYEVMLAPDGEAALDAHASGAADAVLLDVAMPGIDGLEVCRRRAPAATRCPC